MSNFPVVVTYHAKIFIRSANSKSNQVNQYDYVIGVDLPDYYSDYDVLCLLADQLGVRTIGEIIENLAQNNVTIMVDGVKCPVDIQFGQFIVDDERGYDSSEILI